MSIQKYETATDEILSQNVKGIQPKSVEFMLNQIRPEWKSKNLIQRVNRLIPVDPSSACQRLLNASIADLKSKILYAGIDIAKQAAETHKLPPVQSEDDIQENYSTFSIIDLSYRMGILERKDWRKLHRAYEIRRDLEHEDIEYEADIADVYSIFSVCIESILSKDPVVAIKIGEISTLIESPDSILASNQELEDFKSAPQQRQYEILLMLLSKAINKDLPEITRENANNVLKQFSPHVSSSVLMKLGKYLQDKIEKLPRPHKLNEFQIRIAVSANILPYLKRSLVHEFYEEYLNKLTTCGYRWNKNEALAKLLRNIDEIGLFKYMSEDLRYPFLKWMCLCYIGEPGGYGAGKSRDVFYSNIAAPIIIKLFEEIPEWGEAYIDVLEDDEEIKSAMTKNKAIRRRFDQLIDTI